MAEPGAPPKIHGLRALLEWRFFSPVALGELHSFGDLLIIPIINAAIMKTLFALLLLSCSCLAEDYMMFLKDTEVLVVARGMRPMHWTMEKGDCFPVVRIDSKQLTQYASDTTVWDTAVLKLDGATFEVLLGSHHIRAAQLTASDAISLVPASHIAAATTKYKETVKQYRDAVAEERREDDAAETRDQLESLRRQLEEQRREQNNRRQQRR